MFSALLNLLFLAPTIYMLQVYDRVVPTRGESTLLLLTLIVAFALGTLFLLDYVRTRLLVRAGVRLDRQLSAAILSTLLAQRSGPHSTMSKQAMREFDVLRQTLTGTAILALFDAPWTPVYIFVCLLISPWIGSLALVGTVLVLGVAWRNEKATHGPLQVANQAANRSYASQEQSLVGAEVIRALGMRPAIIERHLQERSEMMSLQAQASLAAGRYSALSRFLRTGLQSLALGLGALLAIDNKISGGAIFASAFLVGRALAPVDLLVGSWKSIVQAQGAYATLRELLDEAPQRITPIELPAPKGRLDVERLVVFNQAKDAPILADLSFRLVPGEVVAVVGPSGAGKSTLARALSGGIAPDRGWIRFDGADYNDWDPDRLARYIGYLPQDSLLFSGTVRENISRFAINELDTTVDAAVIRAVQLCGAHDMILRLPNGYETLLGWGGRGLSAGQAQRIALARALYGSPSVLVLDEPNAHLDAEGEANLVGTLKHAKEQGAAVLVIAHRMGIMAVVDKIMVMNGGRIEAFGEKEEILERLRRSSAVSLPTQPDGRA